MGPEPASCGFPEPSECWQPPVCVGEGYAGDSAGKLCFFLGKSVSSRKVQEPARPIPSPAFCTRFLVTLDHVLNSSYTNIKKLSPSLLSPHSTDPLTAKPWPPSPQNPPWLPPHPSKSQSLYYIPQGPTKFPSPPISDLNSLPSSHAGFPAHTPGLLLPQDSSVCLLANSWFSHLIQVSPSL